MHNCWLVAALFGAAGDFRAENADFTGRFDADRDLIAAGLEDGNLDMIADDDVRVIRIGSGTSENEYRIIGGNLLVCVVTFAGMDRLLVARSWVCRLLSKRRILSRYDLCRHLLWIRRGCCHSKSDQPEDIVHTRL